MKINSMKEAFSLFMILCSQGTFCQSIDTTMTIKNIRAEYNLINSTRDKLEQKSWKVIFKTGFDGIAENGDSIWVEDGSPYETITTFSDKNGIRLLIVNGGQYEGYTTFCHEEFYLKDGEIFFYFSKGGCSYCSDPDEPEVKHMTRITESRCYFYQQQKIRELTKFYKTEDEKKLQESANLTPNIDVTVKNVNRTYSWVKKKYSDYKKS
jgi:hypothetical protein